MNESKGKGIWCGINFLSIRNIKMAIISTAIIKSVWSFFTPGLPVIDGVECISTKCSINQISLLFVK